MNVATDNNIDAATPLLLSLYVAGQTPKSLFAFANIKKICEQYSKGKYNIDVIDLLKDPDLAKTDQIFAIPTLVRHHPHPMRKIIGDLTNTERVLIGLEMRSEGDGTLETSK